LHRGADLDDTRLASITSNAWREPIWPFSVTVCA